MYVCVLVAGNFRGSCCKRTGVKILQSYASGLLISYVSLKRSPKPCWKPYISCTRANRTLLLRLAPIDFNNSILPGKKTTIDILFSQTGLFWAVALLSVFCWDSPKICVMLHLVYTLQTSTKTSFLSWVEAETQKPSRRNLRSILNPEPPEVRPSKEHMEAHKLPTGEMEICKLYVYTCMYTYIYICIQRQTIRLYACMYILHRQCAYARKCIGLRMYSMPM